MCELAAPALRTHSVTLTWSPADDSSPSISRRSFVGSIAGGALSFTIVPRHVVALRAGQGKKILYDGANMRVTNDAGANQYLHREYRAGWKL